MDIVTGLDRFLGMADRKAVLDDVFALGDVPEGNFVTLVDIFTGGDGVAAQGNSLALGNRHHSYGYIVTLVDLNQFIAFDHLRSRPSVWRLRR
ncbi:hypothetical protein D3C75_1056390 [compost metagenome]